MGRPIANFILVLILMCSFGCAEISPQKAAKQLSVKKYFDLEKYFQTEVERLTGRESLVKITTINGLEEEQTVKKIDFEKELAIFSKSDINRPAWSDKYIIDSIFNEKGGLVELHYLAKDEKLRTRRISIKLDSAVVSKIEIENATSTFVANNRQSLLYLPGEGYIIESSQKVKTIDSTLLRIKVDY